MQNKKNENLNITEGETTMHATVPHVAHILPHLKENIESCVI